MIYIPTMRRVYSFYMFAPDGFLDYLKTCSDIFARHVEWAFEKMSTNKVQAHRDLYQTIRFEYPEIPANILQATRDQALEAVRQLKFKIRPKKKQYSAVRYDARTIALRGNLLTFSWSGKRIRTLIKLPEYFRKYESWIMKSGTIGYDKIKKQLKVSLIFEAPTPQTVSSNRTVGLDRGLYNIVSLSDGQVYSSQQVRKKKRQFLFVKRQLQAKGTRSAKRLLRKRSGREKRFSSHINHCISKWLVSLPYDIFVLEDLTGIRKQNKGRKLNGWLANWTFFQLETFLQYKAEGIGKQVAKVDARYTSQKCSNCGITEKKNRNKSQYHCDSCGYFEHADINAAKNIKNNHLLSAAEKPAEQAICKLAECLGKPETKPTTLVVG
jgi:putative transposase